jgi:hypothetical protein
MTGVGDVCSASATLTQQQVSGAGAGAQGCEAAPQRAADATTGQASKPVSIHATVHLFRKCVVTL